MSWIKSEQISHRNVHPVVIFMYMYRWHALSGVFTVRENTIFQGQGILTSVGKFCINYISQKSGNFEETGL